MDIARVQQALENANIDGWLLYDFRRNNDLACRFLEIAPETMLTRRLFFWIPRTGSPKKIVHAVELHHLDHLPGEMLTYRSWEQLEAHLAGALRECKVVAMEYSPRNALPYISKVDGGTIDLVRDQGIEVVSSADLLQQFLGVWDDEKLRLHREAAAVVDQTVEQAWQWIAQKLVCGAAPTDYAVQQFILDCFQEAGCIAEGGPICAINADSANPHFTASQQTAKVIQPGDFVLIDLWCKRNLPRATYADICRVGVAAKEPTAKQQKIFDIVKAAQERATQLVIDRFANGQRLMGWEVDQAARDVIGNAGYAEFFTHRTGHNIDESDHGNGTHMDNFETHDMRLVAPGTCFSIEPGIYLPAEFGVRLEYDVIITRKGTVEISGGIQDAIRTLA